MPDNSTPILVGGKHYQSLEHTDLLHAHELTRVQHNLSTEQSSITTGAIFVRSVFFAKHGYKGTLYRIGESCLVEDDNGEHVVLIEKIFTFKITDTYNIFLKGIQYSPVGMHTYSDSAIVKITRNNIIFLDSQVKRKVMLYPNEDNTFIVIDYQRPHIPLSLQDVAIPQYPEAGDLVTVSGDSGDTWFALIHSVNPSTKTCQVYFYIADESNHNLYKREHHRLDTLHWDSILDIKTGATWLTDHTFTLC